MAAAAMWNFVQRSNER